MVLLTQVFDPINHTIHYYMVNSFYNAQFKSGCEGKGDTHQVSDGINHIMHYQMVNVIYRAFEEGVGPKVYFIRCEISFKGC